MGGPLILDFPGKEPTHKEFLGWDPNWGILGVFLYVYVLFSLASRRADALEAQPSGTKLFRTNNSQGGANHEVHIAS